MPLTMPKGERAIQRGWKPSELFTIWDFCQHGFVRFIKMLIWMDGLK